MPETKISPNIATEMYELRKTIFTLFVDFKNESRTIFNRTKSRRARRVTLKIQSSMQEYRVKTTFVNNLTHQQMVKLNQEVLALEKTEKTEKTEKLKMIQSKMCKQNPKPLYKN